MPETIVDYWALELALKRFRFRNPYHEDTLFVHLPPHDQNRIVNEALEIQRERKKPNV